MKKLLLIPLLFIACTTTRNYEQRIQDNTKMIYEVLIKLVEHREVMAKHLEIQMQIDSNQNLFLKTLHYRLLEQETE